jgi:hypothetical protein
MPSYLLPRNGSMYAIGLRCCLSAFHLAVSSMSVTVRYDKERNAYLVCSMTIIIRGTPCCTVSQFSRHLPLGEPKPITLMRERCSEKTSSKLLFDHSAVLSGTRRDTRVLRYMAGLKLKGQEE